MSDQPDRPRPFKLCETGYKTSSYVVGRVATMLLITIQHEQSGRPYMGTPAPSVKVFDVGASAQRRDGDQPVLP